MTTPSLPPDESPRDRVQVASAPADDQAVAEASPAYLNALLHATIDGIMAFEAVRDVAGSVTDFRWTLANPQAARIIGHEPDTLVGRCLLDVLPEHRDQGLFDVYTQVVETGTPATSVFFHDHNGVRTWFQGTVARLGDGFCTVMRDVSDARRADEALKESEARFRLMAENSFDIVTESRMDGTPIYVSPSIERVLGYRPEEVVGRDNNDLIHPDDARALQQAEAAREGAPATEGTIQYRVRHKAGHYVWIELSGRVAFDDAGMPTGLISSARDISARKEVEAALEVRNRELQEFAYAASHDLQEPLRKIRAFADLLVTDYREVLPEEARGYLDRMQAATGRMSLFIRDLLALSRVATRGNSFVAVEPERLLSEVLSDLEVILHETDAEVEAGPLPALQADPLQIRQLFQNLIGNAVKFHRPGVRPHVRVRGRVETTAHTGEQVVFEVEDNGIGFEERYLDRIFAPFQRLHARERYEGSGVGLAICRRIAERHGGTLSARSVPGQGSTFVATFPRAPAEQVLSETAPLP